MIVVLLLQVDGQANPLLQSVHVERFMIRCAHFTADGREVVMAGHRRSFFVYDMVAGKITRVKGIRGEPKIEPHCGYRVLILLFSVVL